MRGSICRSCKRNTVVGALDVWCCAFFANGVRIVAAPRSDEFHGWRSEWFPFNPGTHGPVELRLADEPSDSSKPSLGAGVVQVGLCHQVTELGAWRNTKKAITLRPSYSDHIEKCMAHDICMYINVHISVDVSVCDSLCISLCISLGIFVYMCIYIYVCMNAKSIHTCMRACIVSYCIYKKAYVF